MKRYDRLDFHVYVKRDEINYSVIETRHLSGGWVRTSSHLFFQEALEEKDRCIEKGLRVVLVDTTDVGRPFPKRTYYSPGETKGGVRVEHPQTRKQLDALKANAGARCATCRRPLQGEGYPDKCPDCTPKARVVSADEIAASGHRLDASFYVTGKGRTWK